MAYDVFTTAANQTVFTLSLQPVGTTAVLVSLDDGVLLPTVDYTVSGNTLTLVSPTLAGQRLGAYYNGGVTPAPPTPGVSVTVLGYDTLSNIIYQTAAEVGLNFTKNADPTISTDPAIIRLLALVRSVGAELLKMYEWQSKLVVYQLTTKNGDTGTYQLPPDYEDFVDQTGWQQSYFWPLRGPYSAQMWQRVVNYPTTGIYVAFRIQNNQLWIWPQPPPVNIGITFMYKSRAWVLDSSNGNLKDYVSNSGDVIRFDWLLFTKFLKLRYLESLGHDTTAAKQQFNLAFDVCTSQEQSASPELELAKDSRFPFITGFNSPDTGFGGQPPAGGSYQ